MSKKILLYELNEVPFRIIDEFCRWRPNSSFAKTLPNCYQYETFAEDDGILSPWITWPTLHRGVVNQSHLIHDFGQDLDEVDKEFPPIWKILAANGVSTGVCGSLHTYPMPEDLENYSFFLPDTFASGSECFPKELSTFQEFNLQMARESVRNVSTKVPWKAMLDFLMKAPGLGLKPKTMLDIGLHLASERTKRWKVVRRRTYQSVLAFDIFEKFLRETKPDFSTFFTNHVASSMHRYWAARYPEDYEEIGFDDDWIKTYAREIEFTMSKADEFFARLVRFVDENDDYQLWVATSMGQEATVAQPLETQMYLTNRDNFMSTLGLSRDDWEEFPAMLPRYTFKIKNEMAAQFRNAIKKIAVKAEPVEFGEQAGERFFLKLGQRNLHNHGECVTFAGSPITMEQIGFRNTEIQDLSNTTAYHIPQGSLIVYDPKRATSDGTDRPTITTLDIAPTLLDNFSIPVLDYMNPPAAIAGL